ncbi:similar to yippee-like 3 (predicted), isoform CRA_a [Rattus norvegicus]|uniref:Similar to yippee-like 3 (Predicted), isoform CRA_a n=1 Tax=Rattus norvegicus TaxID=10116 RepID=A6I9D5_RAT|nr:similar to yippee-like 3 (predicted), isoform CRA_a [Rattus norvegicus]
MIVTGGTAVPTAVLTWPTTTTSSPSPSRAVRGVPTSSTLCEYPSPSFLFLTSVVTCDP